MIAEDRRHREAAASGEGAGEIGHGARARAGAERPGGDNRVSRGGCWHDRRNDRRWNDRWNDRRNDRWNDRRRRDWRLDRRQRLNQVLNRDARRGPGRGAVLRPLRDSLSHGVRGRKRIGASLRGGLNDRRAGRGGRADVVRSRLIVRRLLACPSGLASLARQLRTRQRELLAAYPAGGSGGPVEPRNGHAVAGTRHVGRGRMAIRPAAERRHRHAAKAENRLRALGSAMRDDGDAATQADRRDWSSDRRSFGMRRDAADNADHTLAQRKSELSFRGGGIVDEAVNHERRVGADVQGRLVDEQNLDAAGRGGLDLLVRDHLRPDLDHSRGRRATCPRRSC